MYTDPTGHSAWSKFWDKVNDIINDIAQWLDDHNIDIGWIGFEYHSSFGPGGGGSPSAPTTPYEDIGQPYYDYGYSYDPFYDPIVYSSLPPPEPSQTLAPIPQRPLLDITTQELGNIHVLSQIDPIQAAVQSGGFGILDSIPAPEKIQVYGQLPGMLGFSQRARSTKTDLNLGTKIRRAGGMPYSAKGWIVRVGLIGFGSKLITIPNVYTQVAGWTMIGIGAALSVKSVADLYRSGEDIGKSVYNLRSDYNNELDAVLQEMDNSGLRK